LLFAFADDVGRARMGQITVTYRDETVLTGGTVDFSKYNPYYS
jgi:hypothetical protein